jgi:uncharacterized protein YjbI with pentapeptide repeats
VTTPAEPGDTPEDPPVPAEEDTGSSAAPKRTRGRRARVKEPTQQELDVLPAEKRLELINQRLQSRHQTLNSVGILFGVVFTAASLIATALTVRHTQDELRSTKEGQVTDRYTKAVEQLGSAKPEVRLGGIYALERLMADSPRDQRTIMEVLASYGRMHAQDPPAGTDHRSLAVDVRAALTVLGRREQTHSVAHPDLSSIDFGEKNLSKLDLHGANLNYVVLTGAQLHDANLSGASLRLAVMNKVSLWRANLRGADLSGVELNNADLEETDLRGAHLYGAHLYGANLSDAKLTDAKLSDTKLSDTKPNQYASLNDANLSRADLSGAYLIQANLFQANLSRAYLSRANLIQANLSRADLRGANLDGANLAGANLRDANLRDADLRGADLRDVRGMRADEIRKQARTDSTTRF